LGLIKSLKLKNFQSHKESQIDFDEGLTVILGQTDQGKSAIIRALKWVLYNEPRGTDFITAGSKFCQVTLEMEDGSIIIRERDGQRNRYILVQNGQEQVFEGFGNSVPLEITRAHGIPKINIDKDATSAANLAEQLEAPFLISESGSNRAKALGRLVGIHIIDAAQRTTLKDIFDAEQRRKLLYKNIENLNNELLSYQDIDAIAKKISNLNDALKKLKQNKISLAKLIQMRQDLESVNCEIEKNKSILLKLDFIDRIENNIMLLDALYVKHQYLFELMRKLRQIIDSEKAEQDIISVTQSLTSIENSYFIILELNKTLGKLRSINDNFKDNDKNLKHVNIILSKTQDVFSAENNLLESQKLMEIEKKYLLIYNQWELVNQQLDFQKKVVGKYSQLEKSEQYLNSLTQKLSELFLLQDIRKSMINVELSIKKGDDYLQKVLNSLNTMAKEYSQMLEKFAICPTCLKPIDEKTTQKIVLDILN